MLKLASRIAVALALALFWLSAPAQAAPSQSYKNDKLGFSLELPSGWPPPEQTASGALIFSGPKDTPQYRTTITVQSMGLDKGATLQAQAQQALDQWATAQGFKLLSRQEGTLAGSPAVRLEAQYLLPGTNEQFQQEQFIIARPGHFLWMGYTAPLSLYTANQEAMTQAVNSLKLGAAAPASPASPSIAAAGAAATPASQAPAPVPAPAPAAAPALAPQAAPPAAAPPAPSPAQPRVYDLTPCAGIEQGRPMGPASLFPASARAVYVWFRFRDLPPGAMLQSVWHYGQYGQLRKLAEAKAEVRQGADWGEFHLNARSGSTLPLGDYRLEIFLDQAKVGSASFSVR